MSSNIAYQTDQLVRYFAHNRISWSQFYESERVVIDRLNLDASRTILDIGCGCGGLGLALRERFAITDYTGVEINSLAAQAGRTMNSNARILCGDILDLSRGELNGQRFDVVFSLSCVDWNLRFAEMLAAAWRHVLPGGYLVATFRLVDTEGCNDMTRSYQYINYNGIRSGECAAYVVLNARVLLEALNSFDPTEIHAYGYWGVPSATAVTPYQRLCFAAFSIRKRNSETGAPRLQLNLPVEIRDAMALA
jgi:SAM-dependent methyltransferase